MIWFQWKNKHTSKILQANFFITAKIRQYIINLQYISYFKDSDLFALKIHDHFGQAFIPVDVEFFTNPIPAKDRKSIAIIRKINLWYMYFFVIM